MKNIISPFETFKSSNKQNLNAMKLKKLKDVLSMADWIGFKTPILFLHASKEDNRIAFKI